MTSLSTLRDVIWELGPPFLILKEPLSSGFRPARDLSRTAVAESPPKTKKRVGLTPRAFLFGRSCSQSSVDGEKKLPLD